MNHFKNVLMVFKTFQSPQEKRTPLSSLAHKIHKVTECKTLVNQGTQILKTNDYFNFWIGYGDWSCYLSASPPPPPTNSLVWGIFSSRKIDTKQQFSNSI